VGVFAMRWNVEFATREGLFTAVRLLALPFGILWGLVRLLPPWTPEWGTNQTAA
jgi:hypothetical protein